MKKTILVLFILTTLLFSGCKEGGKAEKFDVDIASAGSTIAYAKMYEIQTNPDEYEGKTIRLSGSLGYRQDPVTKEYFYACLVYDNSSCCFLPMEIVTADGSYPTDVASIVVNGTFSSYTLDGEKVARIINAEIE